MPGGLFEADTSFPDLSAKKSTDEKLKAIQDYLYMLLETLRWTLRNLSPENFNLSDMRDWLEEDADVIITNTVITNELYADYGAIADLVVDELRTDYQKARRYLTGNTDDLDYLHIYDENIDFVTGRVKRNALDEPLTEQLHHTFRLHGTRWFWWRDETKTRMTSLEDTGLPVMVYQYDELPKGSFRFQDYRPPGGTLTKVPMLILGAGEGNPDDPDIGRGFIRKGVSSFDLWHHIATDDHGGTADNGMFIGQYTDLVGLRKVTRLDFSGWGDGTQDGSFTETLDGGVTNTFTVEFDQDGVPVKITDAVGHETVVVW